LSSKDQDQDLKFVLKDKDQDKDNNYAGRPARSAAMPVLFLLSGLNIGFFRTAGATRCPDKREIWHRSPLPNFTFIGQKCGKTAPKTVKFARQGSLVCTVFTKFSNFVRGHRWILSFQCNWLLPARGLTTNL